MKRDLGAIVYFLVVTVWITWPFAARLGGALSDSPDSLLNAWALGWSFHTLPRAPLELFDANIFAPRPDTLAYSEHLVGIVAVTWPIYAASGNLVLAYNAAVMLSFVLSGVGMYLLVRDLTGNRWAAVCAGTVFLAAPYRLLHILHVQLLTLQWFPFVFWCLLRFLRGGRTGWLVGVVGFSLLQALSCNYYAVYLAFAMVVFGAVLLGWGRELLTRRRVVLLAAGAVVVAGAALPFFLPYERNRDRGFYRRYEDVVQFSAVSSDYLRPSAFNDAPHWRWLPRQERSEKALFPGAVALVLAGAGMVAGYRMSRDRRERRVMWTFCLVVSAAAVVLSLGPEIRVGERALGLPYRFLYRHVPGFDGMRVPARISVLALFGGSVLAGWGAARLRPGNIAGPALVALLLFDYQTSSLARAFPAAPTIPAVYQHLANADGAGAVLVLPIHEGEAITREALYMYYATVHWKPLVNGFSGWWPNDYWELVGRLRHFPTARSLRFLLERAPVRWIVIHYDRIPQPRRRHLEAAMERYRERMPLRVRIEGDALYEIVPETDAPS
jgi:hypothetical protein